MIYHDVINTNRILLFRPCGGVAYCDQFVCLSVSLSVCQCVCVSASISLESLDRSSRNILWCRSPVAVAQSSSGRVAISGRSLMSTNALFILMMNVFTSVRLTSLSITPMRTAIKQNAECTECR